MIETKRQRIERRYSSLKSERSSFDSHWRDLAQNFMPRRGRFTLSDSNRGDKRHQSIIDGTTIFSVRTMQAGLMSGLTSPARPWFRLTTPDPGLAEFESVKSWLHVCETRMRTIFARSNLYTSLSELYGELGVFGTMAMLRLPDNQKVVRFMPFTAGQFCIAQDYSYRIDTLYREIRQTVRQVVDEYGIENVSARVRTDYERGNYENWVDVLHAIEPNIERISGRGDIAGMAYSSCYYELGARDNGDKALAQRGFRSNPILAARWSLVSGDTYGTSCPGMDALGDARALQLQQRRKAQAIDKWVDPPMGAPFSMNKQPISSLPGGVTYFDATHSGGGIKPLYDWRPDIQYLLQDMAETRDRVRSSFYADLFLMLANTQEGRMTAREVAERHEEKLLALGPVLERLNTELLDPLIDGVFDEMVERSEPYWRGLVDGSPLLPPPPKELANVDLRIEYISVLAQAQKMVGIGALQQLTGYVGQIAAVRPDALDKIDWDQSIDELGDMLGVSPRIVLSDDKVAEIRAERAQQQQAARMAQTAMAAPGIMKDLADTPATGDTALTRVVDMAGLS